MGLFEKIFGTKKETFRPSGTWETLTAYRPSFHTWQGELYEVELVRAAIDARARHSAKLKIELSGSAKPKLMNKLKRRPNDFQTWYQFLYRLSTILDMQNTAFIIPTLGEFGEITGVFSLLPSTCEIVKDSKDQAWIRYTFANGQRASIELSRVGILTKYQYKDDLFGSNNRPMNSTMDLISLQKQGIEEGIKNAATYRFMAQLTNFSTDDDLKKERLRFSGNNLASDAEAGGLLLFPNTYTNIQPIKSTPFVVDAEQMKLIQTNVFDYFGVNEKILQNIATGDEWASFYEGAVEPFAIQLSEVLTSMLFTEKEQANGAGAMATANRLQYMSAADKLAVSQGMADRGLMTRNEIREIWNLPPVEGGDVATIRGEYYTVTDALEGGKEDGDNSREN